MRLLTSPLVVASYVMLSAPVPHSRRIAYCVMAAEEESREPCAQHMAAPGARRRAAGLLAQRAAADSRKPQLSAGAVRKVVRERGMLLVLPDTE